MMEIYKKDSFKVVHSQDNKSFIFSTRAFRAEIDKRLRERAAEDSKIKISQVLEDIAGKVNKPLESLQQWYRGDNGPGDIYAIRDIADLFDTNFMHFLVEKRTELGSMDSDKYEVRGSIDERDVILSMFYKAVDLAEFEAYRFRPDIIGVAGDEAELFYRSLEQKYVDMYRFVDYKGLVILPQTRSRLYTIITELRMNQMEPDLVQERWSKLNKDFYIAKALFRNGEIETEKEEEAEEIITLLNWEIAGDIEQQFISNDEIYRFQYVKTIMAMFKANFPAYFRDGNKPAQPAPANK